MVKNNTYSPMYIQEYIYIQAVLKFDQKIQRGYRHQGDEQGDEKLP